MDITPNSGMHHQSKASDSDKKGKKSTKDSKPKKGKKGLVPQKAAPQECVGESSKHVRDKKERSTDGIGLKPS